MDKTYDQSKVEDKWYKFWEENEYFEADPQSSKTPYSILMPPPNLTGEPHAGHTLQHLIMDALARFKRMQGYDVLFLPGVDHAGIQFESTLTKLLEKEGLSKEKLGREDWLKRAWQFKDEVYKSFHKTWRLLGISADWKEEVFTLDPKVEKAVFHEFKTFWDQNLLYKGAYIVQWCPKDQTAIEDIEMEYEERKEKLYYVNYRIIGTKDEYITVATARPETIFADTAIAVYPNHPKYKKFVRMTAEKPLAPSEKPVDKEIPIIEDARVEKDFGTGALKITPGHDPLDFEIAKDQHHPALPPPIHAIDKTGRMTDIAGSLAGMSVDEARIKAAEILKDIGAFDKPPEDYIHSVPVCERCKTTIEPLISEEWFVKMRSLAEKAQKHIKKINFIPKKYQADLGSWMKKIHDWCISRPLWWGYRIPVWYCQKCNPHHMVVNDENKDKGLVVSLDEPRISCQICGEKHWIQDEKILDTWFSSGLWPIATLDWPNKTPTLKRYFPWDFEITAREIRYLWIARMIMLGVFFMDNIPFKNMFFNGMLRPVSGPKFSKSLGNAVYPQELTDKWGTDAARMALYSYTAPDRDGRTSREILNERAKNYRNFTNKLWNIGRFIIDFAPDDAQHLDKNATIVNNLSRSEDKVIVEKLLQTAEKVSKALDSFRLHDASSELYEFIWHQFADIYIESTKNRRAEAQPTLEYVFKTSLELLHPFMPFITEELWQKLPHEGESVMVTKWPF